MEMHWESDLAELLTDLSAVQEELLQVLDRKRELLVAGRADELAPVAQQEEGLVVKLQDCVSRREVLLRRASDEGRPAGSIQALTDSLPRPRRTELSPRVKVASARARLLRHQSLTNWVLAQRTLIHLSQLLEIIATGGRLQPTYGEREPVNASGSLVDRAI